MVSDEYKQFRVCAWLDSLGACSARLKDVQKAVAHLQSQTDNVRAIRYDGPHVRRGTANRDGILDAIINRDERIAALQDEAEQLRCTVTNAERLIASARAQDGGAHDDCFSYVLDRYARGVEPSRAAASAGLGKYTSKLAARTVAPAIYDSAPDAFAREPGEWGRYGYWQFADGPGE